MMDSMWISRGIMQVIMEVFSHDDRAWASLEPPIGLLSGFNSSGAKCQIPVKTGHWLNVRWVQG
jgi:hypothetical protein